MTSRTKKLHVASFLIAIICLASGIGVSFAQTEVDGRWVNGVTEPWWFDPMPTTKEELSVAQERWLSIEAEAKTSGIDEWAGDYFVGSDTHGSYLRWSPQAGFVMMNVDKCRATVMSFDYGKAVVTNAVVQLFPELNKKTAGHGHAHAATTPISFVRVKWQGEHYLIGSNNLADFGDYVAGLGRFNSKTSFFFEGTEFFAKMKSSDEESKAQFLPIMPPGYEHFVKQPIDAIITRVGKGYVKSNPENEWWNNYMLPVTINVGTAQGVKRGMNFVLLNSEQSEMVEITRVGPQSASGVIVRDTRKQPCVKFDKSDDCTDPEYEDVSIGRKVTTSRFRK